MLMKIITRTKTLEIGVTKDITYKDGVGVKLNGGT